MSMGEGLLCTVKFAFQNNLESVGKWVNRSIKFTLFFFFGNGFGEEFELVSDHGENFPTCVPPGESEVIDEGIEEVLEGVGGE